MLNYVVKYMFKAEVRTKIYNEITNKLLKKIDTTNLIK